MFGVALQHNSQNYRFFGIDFRPDGSAIIFVDRDPAVKSGGYISDDNGIQADSSLDGQMVRFAKWSCHTTGQVKRYADGEYKSSHFIEPLTRLTRVSTVGFYSIPSASKLEIAKLDKNFTEIRTIQIPDNNNERISFVIEVAPKGSFPTSVEIISHNNIYDVGIRACKIDIPAELEFHFVEGGPLEGAFDRAQIDQVTAELEFNKLLRNGIPTIDRRKDGSYEFFAELRMAKPPALTVQFSNPQLTAEQITPPEWSPSSNMAAPEKFQLVTHKVRFWIRDAGGRNKSDDLRSSITNLFLNSRLNREN